MKRWKLGNDGFVMQYMIAGPVETDYSSETTARDQMTLEGKLRHEIVGEMPGEWNEAVEAGKKAENGGCWQVWAPYENAFVDTSKFYSTLKRVSMEAAAVLCAPEDCQVRAKVWTYMAAGIYVNGKLAGKVEYPVYKPISNREVTLSLKKGMNTLLFVCENLGVRDTRNILGVQILERQDELEVMLADESLQEQVYEDGAFLAACRPENGSIVFPEAAGEGVRVFCPPDSPDFFEAHKPARELDVKGMEKVPVPEEMIGVNVSVEREKYTLERTLEFAERNRPLYSEDLSWTGKDKLDEVMRRIAGVKSLNRGEFGFAIMNLLARRYLGQETKEDRDLLVEDLARIEERVDCADFLICGLVRYIKVFGIDKDLEGRVKEVLLNFRYWMTMEGMDAMCFWSENHAMMFYSSAMFVGEMYPDEYFPRARMTGRELSAYGKEKLLDWLKDLEDYGYEEFLSAVYMCVTFAALLNLVDFAEPEIAQRAEKLCDLLMEELAKHSFKGSVIAPMGRVYRGIIYPFSCGTQSIINIMDGTAPYCFGEGWTAYLVGSRYQIPESVKGYLRQEIEEEYSTGNALVRLKKTDDYCLTSVQSPRMDGWMRWPNLREDETARTDCHDFTKSLNESFHGTSLFAPGTYGYQQHLWMAALSGEAVLFVNHPGTTAEKSGMRPGYWYGNGVMPAVRQTGSLLEAIYRIPEEHPIHFTHVYCPKLCYNEVMEEAHWVFLRKDKGYLALWTNGSFEEHNDQIFNCELRVYGSETAYVCLLGSEAEYGSFEKFKEEAKGLMPSYDQEKQCLHTAKDTLQYVKGTDRTQFVE